MNESQLLNLIERGEDQTIEFKSSMKLRQDIGATISAFANATGGVILIGVSDEGRIIGANIGRRTIEDLANWVKENTDPRVYPDVKVRKANGKDVIEISVKESDDKPVFFNDRAYQRVGKTNQRLSAGKIRELAKQEHVRLHWDERICERATLEDIDEEKLKWFLGRARLERRLDVDSGISVQEALERLELTRNSRVTNAAILLFGKRPQRFFLQAETRCGRFKGTEPIEFIDMKVFDGNIIDQREDAIEFVKEHIRLHAKIIGTERVEKWEYPIEAIREAITNAICHRDFEMSANVQVRIFDDRVVIWGCGDLPKPLKLADLRRRHKSVLRNFLIGRCFFLIKFIEQWGTGTNRIITACQEHGLPEPLFEEFSGGLVVTLRKYHLTEDTLRILNERQKKIVEYLREHGRINRKACMDLLDTSKDTAYRELSDLLKRGVVSRTGKGKNINYTLA